MYMYPRVEQHSVQVIIDTALHFTHQSLGSWFLVLAGALASTIRSTGLGKAFAQANLWGLSKTPLVAEWAVTTYVSRCKARWTHDCVTPMMNLSNRFYN